MSFETHNTSRFPIRVGQATFLIMSFCLQIIIQSVSILDSH